MKTTDQCLFFQSFKSSWIYYVQSFVYFMNNNLLNESQFDFLINNSAEHAVLKLTRDIAQNIDNGKFKLGLVIDLSNAFDTIDNKFLPEKLKHRVNERHWLDSEVVFSKENNILKIKMTSNIYLKWLHCRAVVYTWTITFVSLCKRLLPCN